MTFKQASLFAFDEMYSEHQTDHFDFFSHQTFSLLKLWDAHISEPGSSTPRLFHAGDYMALESMLQKDQFDCPF